MALFRKRESRPAGSAHEAQRLAAGMLGLVDQFQDFGSDRVRWERLDSEGVGDGWLASRVAHLLNTDEGWQEANTAVSGVPVAMIRSLGTTQARTVLDAQDLPRPVPHGRESDFADGLMRCAFTGWIVGYAYWGARGWVPKGEQVDSDTVFASAAEKFGARDPSSIPDEVFYVTESYRGLAVYQWTLKDLGWDAPTVLSTNSLRAVVTLGGLCMDIGWTFAEAQRDAGY